MMTSAQVSRVATLASKMMLTPAQAVALPTALTVAAGKLGWAECRLVEEMFANGPLRDYLASVCRTTMAD